MLTFICNNVFSQITLDATIDSANLIYFFNSVQISDNETKYYIADTVNNSFNLYNMDFTPFIQNIPVPEPFIKQGNTTTIFRVIYISRSLFDCDTSNIEYAYEAATHSEERFYIMRTDGTELFHLDSANGPYCFGDCLGGADWIKPIVKTSDGTKLFLQRYWGGVSIFSLCGSLPNGHDAIAENGFQSFVKVYPNPSGDRINFKVTLPNNMEQFCLEISDINGRVVKRESIHSFDDYILDTSNFPSGNYNFRLVTKNQNIQNGKFIINH